MAFKCRKTYVLLILSIFTTVIAKKGKIDGPRASYKIKLKQIDMEYGEKMSSVEGAQGRNNTDPQTQDLNMKVSTKCTTDEAITLDPSYVPSSSENDDKNMIDDHSQDSANAEGEYKAPAHPVRKPYYIDDYK